MQFQKSIIFSLHRLTQVQPLLKFFIFGFVFLQSCSETTERKINDPVKERYSSGPLEKFLDKSLAPFYHGVASGDPTQDAVIIWTRVTPEFVGDIDVIYEVSEKNDFSKILKEGNINTGPDKDYTVKVDITGLEPGKYYFYRFKAGGKYSITGRTKTFPENAEEVKLAFASCSNYSWGYFNAYEAIANDTVDAVVHLGDYIYEHEPGTYSSKVISRDNIPDHELITLEDYRIRYAQYRLDEYLRHAHQQHPFIVEWDDHELANNAYETGAQNHQENEGDWNERRKAAMKAYYEWLPVRESAERHLYRAFSIGNLVKLVMIDNRTEGRDIQVKNSKDEHYLDSNRRMLGKKQFEWSLRELSSNETWKLIANPVLFGELKIPGWGNNDFYMDGWDGYPIEKHNWAKSIIEKNANIFFITGDFHSSFSLKGGYTSKGNYNVVGNEYVVPSITSGNYDEDVSMDTVLQIENDFRKLNRNMDFVNLHDHGYVKVNITQEKVITTFKYVSTVTAKTYTVRGNDQFILRKK